MSRGFECDIKLEMFSVYPISSIELSPVTKFIVGPNHFTQNHRFAVKKSYLYNYIGRSIPRKYMVES